MKELNESQRAVYNFLRQRISEGVPPSVREICKATGIKSTSSVHYYLKDLERLGYISREAGYNRSIKIPNTSCIYIPLLKDIKSDINADIDARFKQFFKRIRFVRK